ncbi:MAG: ABC transporter ATP-binding protein [Rickettsiales bacterium]|nr:ABC transporter ATP-binding protein [Pseudomonadota bacterium]MDA0967438.1 ABC transporter ATP-binding protein [Pseudomonadota bacterium]MDG4544194.1 ABC transporter ATP-binding protein [Rickettsiales bacterium]MDG4546375.1 ABC transporter ATP-binding protein [Rickettsiales bacterium]MDG4548518.1 ABC transporter ATP-binding protein [Rickettsiales bacterium]
MKKQSTLSKTLDVFSSKEKFGLFLLFLSMVIAAILEMAGVGLIMPFIALLDKPEIVHNNEFAARIYAMSGAESYKQFMLICSGGLILFYLAKNIFLGFIIYRQSVFLAKSEANVGVNLLKKYLSMPYLRYVERNTAELVNNITIESTLLFAGLIKPIFFILSDALVTICIMALLLYIAPLATLCAVGVILLSASIFYIILRNPLKSLGESRRYHRQKMIQWVTQSLGSMKEITVLGRKKFFEDSFKEHASQMIKTQTFYETVIQLPRVIIESFGVIMLVIIMVILINEGGNFIPTLSLFAMAAFRLMPSINRITSSATKVRYYLKTLNNLHEDLNAKDYDNSTASDKTIKFASEIKLDNISFAYPDTNRNVIDGLSLTVKKGSSIGIIGPSGEGKSTLVDIILGLLPVNKGSVLVDGVNISENLKQWHKHISYMPQAVYLTDDTIKRNVALGVADEDIDDELIWNCLDKAQLADKVRSLPEGLDTTVGEQGTKLSGGQRQRIGIARALYNNPQVLVLDEATTALDPQTEEKICNTLKEISEEVTIIAISHQPKLISITDEVYRLSEGKLHIQKF